VPEPSAFEVEMPIENLIRDTSPGIDQFPAEFIKAGCRKIRSEIHKFIILFGKRRNCLRSRMIRSLYLYIRRVIKHVVIIEAYHSFQLRTKFYLTSCCQVKLHVQRKLLENIMVDFAPTGQLQITLSAFVK